MGIGFGDPGHGRLLRRAPGPHAARLTVPSAIVFSGPALLPTAGLRRRPTLRPRLRTRPSGSRRLPRPPAGLCANRRLASPISLPALPTNPASGSPRLLRLRPGFRSIYGLRRRSALGPAFELSVLRWTFDLRRLPSAVRCHPEARPFRLTSGLRRRSTLLLRLRNSTPTLPAVASPASLPINLRLAPPIDLPAAPSKSASGSHRLPHPRLGLPVDLRLAPPIDLPAPPSELNPPTLHRWLHLRLGPLTDPRLSPLIDLPAAPSNSACRLSPATASPARPFG